MSAALVTCQYGRVPHQYDRACVNARPLYADPVADFDRARREAERLLRMEREHTGTGREGHLSEDDLRPLLHALGIDTEEGS